MRVRGGIDPGNSGALVLIIEDGMSVDVEFFDAPTAEVKNGKKTSKVLIPSEMARPLRNLHLDWDTRIYIEKVHAMRDQGRSSIFNFGSGYGMWLGILAALEIPYSFITPQAWKKATMAGMGKEKDASCVRAMQLFPKYANELQRPKRGGGVVYLDGRGDALLIAEYNRRQG